MIRCPRCGFEQPRDRFCAKCGRDMENFIPQNEAKSKSYFKFTTLAVAGVLIFFGLGLWYLYKGRTPTEPESKPMANRPMNRGVSPQRPNTYAQKAMNFINSNPEQPPHAEMPNPEQPTPGESPAAVQEVTSISVDFDLVTKDVMDRMALEGEGHLEVGSFSMAIVPNFRGKYDGVRSDTGFSQLGSDTRTLSFSQPSLVFRGGKEPKNNDEIGFFVETTPVRKTDTGTEYKISIKRTLPELSQNGDVKVTSQNFDNSVVVANGSGVVIAGLLPRKPLLEGEDKLYETNILKALNEPAFQKGDTEFVVVLYPY